MGRSKQIAVWPLWVGGRSKKNDCQDHSVAAFAGKPLSTLRYTVGRLLYSLMEARKDTHLGWLVCYGPKAGYYTSDLDDGE